MKRRAALCACIALAWAGCGGGDDAPDQSEEDEPPAEPELALAEIGSFEEPIALAGTRDGLLYIAERGGIVKELEADGLEKPRTILDISTDVSTEGEGGLLSIAAEPSGRRIFVSYSGRDKQLHLERVTLDGDGRAGERKELLTVPHPNEVHWGGHVALDDIGLVYFSTGDGGPVAPRPLVSQDPEDLRGKLLRIDPDADPAFVKPEVIAIGLRNPWRFSIDHEDIWIGDVGDFIQEEVDLASVGFNENAPNFGWPILEGTAKTGVEDKGEELTAPVLTYERSGKPDDPNCAITGGHVVRDPELEPLEGRYIYADYCAGVIMSAEPSGDGLSEPEETGLELLRIASFAQDPDGHSYAIALPGKVYRLVYE